MHVLILLHIYYTITMPVDSSFTITKNPSHPNSSLTIRTSGVTTAKYLNYMMVTVPGEITIS